MGGADRKSRLDVVTQERTAWAWITAPVSVSAAAGDPVSVTTRDGAPVLTGEVTKVERSHRHLRIIARPVSLADMDRRQVPAVALVDPMVPDVLAHALGDHQHRVLPPLSAMPVALWTTRERSQRWALESGLRMLQHNGQPATWRYSARDDEILIFEPGGDEQRMEHQIDDALFARGGAVEVSAVRTQVQAGDMLNGALVREVRTCWMHRIKRSLVFTAAPEAAA